MQQNVHFELVSNADNKVGMIIEKYTVKQLTWEHVQIVFDKPTCFGFNDECQLVC